MFQNLKLRTKLVAIVAPPLFVLAVVAAYSVLLSSRGSTTLDELSADIRTLGVVALAAFLLSALSVIVVGRTISDPIDDLSATARELAETRLPALIETLRNPGAEPPSFEPLPIGNNDELAGLVESFNSVQVGIAELAIEQRNIVREGLSELVINLARRNQSLLDRQIEVIDRLEADEEDPDRLEELFSLDHLATRMRRNAESLLVVAGAEPARRRGGPVEVADALRVAMSEIEDYRHVKLVHVEDAEIGAQSAVDLAHLFSEVLENATQFSPPDSPVEVTGVSHPDGSYMISCVDHGIGMTAEQLAKANDVLRNPPELGLGLTRSLGFIVVGRLAQRLGVSVELTHTPNGGITAIAEVPASVLSGAALPTRHASEMPPAPMTASGLEAMTATPLTDGQPASPIGDDVPEPATSGAPASDEVWTPPAMPERGANLFGTPPPSGVEEAPAVPPASPFAAPAMPAAFQPNADPVPSPVSEPTPVAQAPAGGAQSEALAKLLGLTPTSLDQPPPAPAPPAPSESSSMIFGRPVESRPQQDAADEPWVPPVFDPNELRVEVEPVAIETSPSKLEEAIPTGESFDSGMESLLQDEPAASSGSLVRRDRSVNHAPQSEGRRVASSVRSPDEIRSMLARYRSGLKGKPLSDLATPPMPDGLPNMGYDLGAPPAPPVEPESFDSFNPGPGDPDPFGTDSESSAMPAAPDPAFGNPRPFGEDGLDGDAFDNDFRDNFQHDFDPNGENS